MQLLSVGHHAKITWGICTRRAGKLYKPRSPLYRSQNLQKHMRWKALAEIYTMHSFAPFSMLIFPFLFLFFRRDALKEQFGKEPSTVRCLAVKSALLGTRHPRKEKEAALRNVTGEPACLYGKIIMTTQSEMEPSIKI